MIKWETLKFEKTSGHFDLALINAILTTFIWAIPMWLVGVIMAKNAGPDVGWYLPVAGRWVFGIIGTLLTGSHIFVYLSGIKKCIKYEAEFTFEGTGLQCLMLTGPYVWENTHSSISERIKRDYPDVPFVAKLRNRIVEYRDGKYYIPRNRKV